MQLRGQIVSVYPDITLDQVFIQISTTKACMDEIQSVRDIPDLDIEIKKHREKRSLSANAYYFLLIGKLADELKVSKNYLHNIMLRRYGQLKKYDGSPLWVVIPDTDEASKTVDEDSISHMKPTSGTKVGKDGTVYRIYLLLKGSHEMDKKEFSILLDGLISECKEVGIQTATPEEIQQMKERWKVEIGSD